MSAADDSRAHSDIHLFMHECGDALGRVSSVWLRSIEEMRIDTRTKFLAQKVV